VSLEPSLHEDRTPPVPAASRRRARQALLGAALAAATLLSGCAGTGEIQRQGDALIAEGRTAEGIALLEQAAARSPDDLALRMRLVRAREREASAAAAAAAASATAQAEAARQRAAAQAAQATPAPPPPPALRPALRRPVTIEFRDAPLRQVFDALARSTGLNFVFDREVRSDARVTLAVTDTGIDDVIGLIALTQQLEHKLLNDNTVLLYPASAAKLREYQDLSVRTFYLANADVKTVYAMLKTVLKSRDLHADERLNSLTLRDTPHAIALAEQLIAAQDLAEPEVLLDVEVLEVKRSRLTEIGLQPPGTFSVLNIVPRPSTVVSTATGATTVVDNTLTTTQLTLDRLRNVRSSSVGVDNPQLNLRAESGDTNLLANPRIRVKNRDKARVLIGDRVPVITTTSTANVGVAESVAYLDVGLKLDVEPTISLDQEVGVKVSLEVSNVVREVRSRSGTLTYQIGTRLATTNLRLRDGETQALAGLISDEDRRAASGWPGATDLPIVGRLFSSQRNDRNKTEIVLLLTPRIVRTLATAPHVGAVPSGTEAASGRPALLLRRGADAAAAAAAPVAPAAPAAAGVAR
jgi:general secretion pathway protein D